MRFPEAVFYERLRYPDQLYCAGRDFPFRRLDEEGLLKFDTVFGLSRGDHAENGGSKAPMKSPHGVFIDKLVAVH